MKTAYAEFESLVRSWNELRAARSGEVDLSPYGLKNGSATDFDELFNEWLDALKRLAENTSQVSSQDNAIESIALNSIVNLKNIISPAVSNGFQWLIQSGFAQKVSELNVALVPIINKRFRVRREVIKSAQRTVGDGISLIEKVVPVAKNILAQCELISEQAQSAAASLLEIEKVKEGLAETQADVSELLDSIRQRKEDVANSRAGYDSIVSGLNERVRDAEKLLEDAESARISAEDVLKGILRDRDAADQKIVEGGRQLDVAINLLSGAITDISRQGLSGAFNESAKSMGAERKRWNIIFFASIIYLFCVALLSFFSGGGILGYLLGSFGLDAPPLSEKSRFFWEKMLQFLPLAAPGVWVGWFSARNSSLIARVQQDYLYKAVTAQSFDAYKKEVDAIGDDELKRKLLEASIRNFGDNPIRIFSGTGVEGHPIECLKEVINSKNFDKIISLVDSWRSAK